MDAERNNGTREINNGKRWFGYALLFLPLAAILNTLTEDLYIAAYVSLVGKVSALI